MSRVNPYVLLDYVHVIIYDCLCFRLNKPKVRFTTLAYKYLVCAKEAALRRLRIIATIYSAFYRSIQHDENKEWQLANCVNRNFNPSIKPAGKKTVDNTGQISVDENKTEGDVRSSEAVHTRFGRRIQFPKKYAQDFEVEN